MVNLVIFYRVDLVQFGFQRKDATKTPIEFHFKHRKNCTLRLFSRYRYNFLFEGFSWFKCYLIGDCFSYILFALDFLGRKDYTMIWTKSIPYNLLYPLPYEMHIFTWLHAEPFLHSLRHIMPQNPKPILLWFLFLFVCFCFRLEFADSTCRFFCSIYFAEQFRLLRKRIFADGEEKYELHFVIDYMSRSYGTRKLLYSLIPWTPIPRRGVFSGRFLVGVWYAVTQFEWVYSSAPVRVWFPQVQTLHGIFPYRVFKTWSIRTVRNKSPLYKREGDGNLNVSRNCFWNRDLIDQSGQ